MAVSLPSAKKLLLGGGSQRSAPFVSSGSFEAGDDAWIFTSSSGRSFARRAQSARSGSYCVFDNTDGSGVSGYGRKTFARKDAAGLRIAASIWAARTNNSAITYLRAYGTKDDGSYGTLAEAIVDYTDNSGVYRQLTLDFKLPIRPKHDLLIEFAGGAYHCFDDWSIMGTLS